MDDNIRECPECGIKIKYSTKYTKINADNNNSVCRSCASSGEKNGMFGITGHTNPFYGKHHTKESIDKIRKNADRSFTQTKEFKDKISELNSGNKNPMYGKSVYDVWVTKYGIEIANHKMEQYRKKQSKLNSFPLF